MEIKQGDVFVTTSPSWIAKAINSVSGFWSSDGQSKYSHAGIVVSKCGVTFEALKQLNYGTMDRYIGKPVMIVRPKVRRADVVQALQEIVTEYQGDVYPAWRILLHLVPPLARKISNDGKFLVCSELVAKYLHKVGLRHNMFTGTTPDTLAEEWRHWKDFEIVYEGVWE